MKIVVLQGSPNLNGSTSILVNEFKRGAEEADHQVTVFHASRTNVRPCIGCVKCGYDGPCVQRDGMDEIRQALLSAEMLMLATPLYYYGMTAQLKTIIDRFCAFNFKLTARHLKSALLSVAWNNDDWTFDALESHYRTLVRYLDLNDQGMVLGGGCGTPEMTRRSPYPQRAYALGKNL